MKGVRYPAEFKAEAVKQVNERSQGVVDVAKGSTLMQITSLLAVTMALGRQQAHCYKNHKKKPRINPGFSRF